MVRRGLVGIWDHHQRAGAAGGRACPKVHTWADLTDPRLAGWISASRSRAPPAALWHIYEIILQSYGWDKGWAVLMEMSGNVRNFLSSSAASAVEVGVGDAAYGVAIDSYGQAQAGYYGPENVSFVLPEGQTVITPDCIAILKNPPHPELARHFMEFVLSPRRPASLDAAQGLARRRDALPDQSHERAARPLRRTGGRDADSHEPVQDAAPISSIPNKLGSKRRAILSVLIAAWMIDTHDAWRRRGRRCNSPAAQKLSPKNGRRCWPNLSRHPARKRSCCDSRKTSGRIR